MSPINKKLFKGSVRHVRKELRTMGFASEQLMETKVARTVLPSINKKGYFTHYGEIYIPIFQPKGGIRDVLRHEYAHALLHHFPQIKTQKGYSYFGQTADKNDYVSNYAMTNEEEDFCETFMEYMRFKGKIPQKYLSVNLMRKWNFINGLRGPSVSSRRQQRRQRRER